MSSDDNECPWCGSYGPLFLHQEMSTEMLEFWVCDGCLRIMEAHDRRPGTNQIQVDDTIYPSDGWIPQTMAHRGWDWE